MKKINFSQHIFPHILAVLVFLVVTIFFFKPIFFDGKGLQQHDIQQYQGGAREIIDYRKETGKEALWTNSMFGGMPAYLISVQWSNQPIAYLKKILTVGMPHPVNNIMAALVCYYILLLTFGVRPYLAIAGALAFGFSSYMIIGLSAGHNARIGAIAFMPLVVAGIHLVFSNRRWLGFGVTAAALSLHLRENHLQITYYLILILAGYGIMQVIVSIKEKRINSLLKNTGMLIMAVILAVGTFFGPLWAIQEYSTFSTRGKSELVSTKESNVTISGLDKDYAFQYSSGVWESMTLMIPNIYGGSSMNYLVSDRNSKTYQALVTSADEQLANQLANYSSAYWGSQPLTSPYYAGAIICFLFFVSITLVDKKYFGWLFPMSMLGIIMSWGNNFEIFNYFLFDHLPGYNKFRSVTFALVLVLFSMPLLGMLGLEKIISLSWKEVKKKLLWPISIVVGVCLLLAFTGGFGSFLREGESQLPQWFINALQKDREALLRSDAWRSFWFILLASIGVWAWMRKYINDSVFALILGLLIIIDLTAVDTRYFTKDNYIRKRDQSHVAATEVDSEILKDKGYYRVYNIQPGSFTSEARTSYHHHSVGGYHGAKIRRYQDLYDSCLYAQTNQFIENIQNGTPAFDTYGVINMLNIKYLTFGPQRNNFIANPEANGPAWLVYNIEEVNSPNEELEKVCGINTKTTAVIDHSKFKTRNLEKDTLGTIELKSYKPNELIYESNSSTNSFAVFSEIYYPNGWVATVDGQETPIIRANYILRALEIPAGKHVVSFQFKPASYYIGNKITILSSWLVVFVLVVSIGSRVQKN